MIFIYLGRQGPEGAAGIQGIYTYKIFKNAWTVI